MTDPIYIKASIDIDYKQLEILADNSYELSVYHLQKYYSDNDADIIQCLRDADQAVTSSLNLKELLRENIKKDDKTKRYFDEKNNLVLVQKIRICLKRQDFREALEVLERSKSRVLSERIQERNQEKYQYITFEEIKALVDDYTAILEWFIFDKDCFGVFIILPKEDSPKCLIYPERTWILIERWADAYRKSYDTEPSEWLDKLNQRIINLGNILQLETIIRDYLSDSITNLILIPHRYLHLFPIHALPVTHNTAKYLIDAFPGGVSYAPSCQILHQVQKYKRGKFDKLFAIQNPTDDLMAADMEVETIKNIFPHPDSEIISKENAKKGKKSEEKLEIAERVANSHHLFFSCHGYFDRNDPLKSGLQLADGILTLEEILRHFNLSECSLVTLSACETGQVQLDNTDEYISLTSGFLLAGSPSLYVTLWSVNAFSTAILLIKTYENLYQQPGKLALALNQAQIWVRDTDVQGFLDWTNQCHLLDQKWRETLQRNLNRELRNQGTHAKIYQNPYHWAGFCAAGKGEQKMTNSIKKIEIFQQIIQETDLFVNLRDALVSLKDQLTDNDEDNVKIIEAWIKGLPENDKENIQAEYEHYQLNVEMLGNKAQSSTKPGERKNLKEIIRENLTVAENNPQLKEKPPSP